MGRVREELRHFMVNVRDEKVKQNRHGARIEILCQVGYYSRRGAGTLQRLVFQKLPLADALAFLQ